MNLFHVAFLTTDCRTSSIKGISKSDKKKVKLRPTIFFSWSWILRNYNAAAFIEYKLQWMNFRSEAFCGARAVSAGVQKLSVPRSFQFSILMLSSSACESERKKKLCTRDDRARASMLLTTRRKTKHENFSSQHSVAETPRRDRDRKAKELTRVFLKSF